MKISDCNSILITNIQRFSLHDGPGIRTTVFLKGCSLHCPWCSNPENIRNTQELYQKDGRRYIFGRWISCEDLYWEIIKDRVFFDAVAEESGAYTGMPGGVTFSGGEPLLQMWNLEPLLKRLKEDGIHLCVETALFVPEEMVNVVIQYIDLFYVDIKILDEKLCRNILGGDLKQYIFNVDRVLLSGKPVIFRVPVIGGFTDYEANREEVIEFLKRFKPIKVELIKEHNLGSNKYQSLGKEPLVLNTVTDKEMQLYQMEIIYNTCLETEICMI